MAICCGYFEGFLYFLGVLDVGSRLGCRFVVGILALFCLTFLQKRRATSVRVIWSGWRAEISHMSQKTAFFVFVVSGDCWPTNYDGPNNYEEGVT